MVSFYIDCIYIYPRLVTIKKKMQFFWIRKLSTFNNWTCAPKTIQSCILNSMCFFLVKFITIYVWDAYFVSQTDWTLIREWRKHHAKARIVFCEPEPCSKVWLKVDGIRHVIILIKNILPANGTLSGNY